MSTNSPMTRTWRNEMNKLVLLTTALLLTHATFASAADKTFCPELNVANGSEVLVTHDALLVQQRQEILADMRKSLPSTLIIKQAPTLTASRSSSLSKNHQL